MVLDFLALATQQKDLLRTPVSHEKTELADMIPKLEVLAGKIENFTQRYSSFELDYMASMKTKLEQEYARKPANRPAKVSFQEARIALEKIHRDFFGWGKNMLDKILQNLQTASSELKAGGADNSLTAQNLSNDLCRVFFIEHVLKFMVLPGPPISAPPAPSFDISTEDSLLMEAAGMVRGNALRGGRLEWEVLGKRDRAALNENFARELPLEYRGLLKDYFERLAQ